ncbi:hypothetical protein ACFLXM_01840 [Chloroflexota bacterium]
MRKIISILIALGLVLSLSAIATPVAADVTQPQVTVVPDCACADAVYNITFNTTASLTEGVHSVCIDFPAGTTVPATYANGDITINGFSVFGSEVTVTGNKVCFLTPLEILAGPIEVIFTASADIENPCTPGSYTLFVNTDRAPDSTPVESAAYTIAPAISTYKFSVDFGETYPGIADDFVPPFKACGQDDTGADFDTTYNASIPGWLSGFNLTFLTELEGCAVPCVNASIWFEVTACPADEVITLLLDGVWYTMDDTNVTTEVGVYGSEDFVVDPALTLLTLMEVIYYGELHFSSVGSYQICFYAECPEIGGCDPEASDIIAERCLDFEVHQWKDAAKITLDEKWNLISLPLVPFDTDIDAILAALPAAGLAQLVSIWNYDGCTGEWFVYGNGQDSLTDLEDGKGYWVRMTYPMAGTYDLWVWGTEKPMPPAAPAEYAVCEGWNMFGFTSLSAMTAATYLWNWGAPDPVIYEWTAGDWTAQGWAMVAMGANLNPGQGYWGAFPAAGAIYVP